MLCDEVGLGKTIEAGLVIKEYLLRGMAERILILTPPGLVQQWREELAQKFGLRDFVTNAEENFRLAGMGPGDNFRFLTATPVENQLEELYNLITILNTGPVQNAPGVPPPVCGARRPPFAPKPGPSA